MNNYEAAKWIRSHAIDHINAFTTKSELKEAEEAQLKAIAALECMSKLEEIFESWHEGDISHLDAYKLFEKELSL